MPNYQNTVIYKIYCKDESITEIYIGSTTNFIKRRSSHKSICYNEKNKDYNLNVYQFIRANGGWDNWNMIEIEKYNAIDRHDAKKKERYWIEQLKANLNSCIPSRSKKEHYIDNKQIILEKNKQYNENNKQIILEKNKEYYENNKQIILEKHKETIICVCGCKITKHNLNQHLKTTKHQLLMQFKNEPFNNDDE